MLAQHFRQPNAGRTHQIRVIGGRYEGALLRECFAGDVDVHATS
jgi:hypothetical protein